MMDSEAARNAAFFEAAFDAAPDAIVVFDDDGTYLYANEAASELFSLSREALRQRRIGDFTSASDQGRIDAWWAALRKEQMVEGRHSFIGADQRERTVVFRTRANFVPGRHIAVFRENTVGRLRLSEREQQVLRLVAEGLNGAAIAGRIGISPETVRTHVRNAMDKLGTRSREHAVALAAALGEI
jgi:PAS domain S-box-containing protein